MVVGSGQALPRNLFTIHYHLFVELAGHRGTPLYHRAPKFLLPLLGDGEIRRLGDSSPNTSQSPKLQDSQQRKQSKFWSRAVPCRARISSFRSAIKDQCPLRGNPNGFGLGRATNSVPLNAGRHMPPHVLSEGFQSRFSAKTAKPSLPASFTPPFLLAQKEFRRFFRCESF